ncbi:sulfonate transport system permease protein [Paenibacillus sp. LBL]|uniref:ABC transporter permease n=1 Tax=Paenibacillus sp. LBL TaxID=2940563 RepID=UPI00247722F1|nr:ABC transporter permease [Paenibacillus sp. LBL]MDH6670633.1 sulfonate transport system permease protein [Paenibacillus sp. LBL]
MKSEIAARKAAGQDWLRAVPGPLHAWLVPIAIVALWQIAGGLGWISATLLPTPLTIAKQFVSLGLSGELWEHFQISILRALSGFVLGGLTGLALGLSTGLGKMAERTLDPSLQMLRTVPLLSLIPLFILWFGIGEFSKILMISLGAFFPMYVNTFLGIRSVDVKLYDVSRIFQYSKLQLVTRLIIPAALPNILLGIRLSLGVSWLVLVVAEMMGTSAGIGYMIQDARAYSQTDIVFVGIIIFAIVGKLSDSVVRLLESKLLRWRETYKG